MGYSISWVAFREMTKPDVLARLRFRDLGEVDEANEAPFSIAELPNRWIVVFSNDFEYGAPKNVRPLSGGTMLASCQVEEHVMFSAAHGFAEGAHAWSVWHDGGEVGPYDIHASGEPPAQFEAIKRRLQEEQDANGGEAGDVDFGFDIPVELAADVTSYRHDQWKFPWGEPRFTVVEPTRSFWLPFIRRG
jgi:hypothetical protein